MTYSRAINRNSSAVMLYDTKASQLSQLTSGYYADNSPTFSEDGKHLFFMTNRTFSALYSDLDNTFIYPNTTGIAVATLHKGTESLLAVKNDKVEDAEEDKEEEADTKKKDKKKKADTEAAKASPAIDIAGFEERVEMLDIDAGNMNDLTGVEGKLLFMRYPNSGTEGGSPSLDYYDIEEREVKTIMAKVGGYEVSADGKKILVLEGSTLGVIDVAADQKIEKPVPTEDMVMNLIPKEEWQQIFTDTWRLSRDYFYDPGMHGVDWNLMKTRYGILVAQASTRDDVNIILGDLIAELNSSHTYTGGGDRETAERVSVGYLGADYRLENGQYRITKIINGAAWDAEVRSPLNKPGVTVNVGDYILAVNGEAIDTSKPIYAAFQGLADKVVELTVNSSASTTGAKKVIIKAMSSETRLRHLAWIEANRKRVDEATNGKVGYIYVRSTGRDGQRELVRQFYGQMQKEGMIIDERFNSGGQIPDRFIELLDRDPLAFWDTRDGEDWAWPPAGNFGAKVMLINGFSGSGGDAFPDYFRKRGLGPLIGTRTWGGLIGISGAPSLIDNGYVTVPTFRMYDPDGAWFKEGHGVDPDIEVIEDFEQLANGKDVQLEKGIEEVMRLMNSSSQFKKPATPKVEDRK
jgi:tricorn protease